MGDLGHLRPIASSLLPAKAFFVVCQAPRPKLGSSLEHLDAQSQRSLASFPPTLLYIEGPTRLPLARCDLGCFLYKDPVIAVCPPPPFQKLPRAEKLKTCPA